MHSELHQVERVIFGHGRSLVLLVLEEASGVAIFGSDDGAAHILHGPGILQQYLTCALLYRMIFLFDWGIWVAVIKFCLRIHFSFLFYILERAEVELFRSLDILFEHGECLLICGSYCGCLEKDPFLLCRRASLRDVSLRRVGLDVYFDGFFQGIGEVSGLEASVYQNLRGWIANITGLFSQSFCLLLSIREDLKCLFLHPCAYWTPTTARLSGSRGWAPGFFRLFFDAFWSQPGP